MEKLTGLPTHGRKLINFDVDSPFTSINVPFDELLDELPSSQKIPLPVNCFLIPFVCVKNFISRFVYRDGTEPQHGAC